MSSDGNKTPLWLQRLIELLMQQLKVNRSFNCQVRDKCFLKKIA
jgi:hypothetical protein